MTHLLHSKTYLFLFLMIIGFSSINAQSISYYPKSVNFALSKAGNNKDELIKVLEHFNQKEGDSLKYRAACSLISNIPIYSSRDNYQDFDNLIDFLQQEKTNQTEQGIEEKKIRDYVRKTFEENSESVYRLNRKKKHGLVKDIDILKSEFLISNIELAFAAHNKLPQEYQSNFEDFKNYVLPYRAASEPLEFNKRQEFYEKYNWVYDSIKEKPLEEIIEKIYEDLSLDGGQSLLYRVNGLLSLSQIEKLGFGRCDDIVNYFVMLFRSLGFAAGQDYITHWGNFYHSSGHSWVFLKIKENIYPIQVSVDNYSNSTSKRIFKVGSMPKIFRNNFINIDEKTLDTLPREDVTNTYRLTSDINVKNSFMSNFNNNFKLCVYDNQKQWAIVDDNYFYNNSIVGFNNVGRGILYSIAILDKKILKLVNHPFYLDFNGKLTFLDNEGFTNRLSFVLRKYPPFFPHINVKIDRLKTLNHCKLQGSNNLKEEDFIDIYKIEDFSTSQKVNLYFKDVKNYKYYRLVSSKDVVIHLAGFNLLNKSGKPFKNLELAYNGLETFDRLIKVIDDDPLTYVEFKNLNITFEIPDNEPVSGFQIQARNDDNHINIGEEYELLLYDRGWKSIKKEIAQDTVLRYGDLHVNGLYRVKNLTKGREENVFSFDDQGNQFWFGVSDIGGILDKIQD